MMTVAKDISCSSLQAVNVPFNTRFHDMAEATLRVQPFPCSEDVHLRAFSGSQRPMDTNEPSAGIR